MEPASEYNFRKRTEAEAGHTIRVAATWPENICSGIGRNLCDCSLPVDRRRCQCRNGWCIIGFYPGILRTSGTAEESGRRRIEAENEVYAPELAGCSEKYVVFANERALIVYGRQEKSFWRHWICRQWTAIILIPTVSIPVRCCRKTRYIF